MSDNEKKPKIGNRLGFIETIDDMLILYRGLIKERPENFPFQEIVELQQVVEALKHCDLYYMGEEFSDIINNYKEQFDDAMMDEMRFSEFTRPPSKVCYIRLAHHEGLLNDKNLKNMGFITEYFEDKKTLVKCVVPLSKPMTVGAYHPDLGLMFPKDDPNEKVQLAGDLLIRIAGAFELINNPRYTISSLAGTRSQRKQMKREQDIALEAWHKITWNVDDDSIEVNNGDRGGWHMPLHYTRGHFRKAEPHWENVVWRKDGKPYKWIEGFWSGHPAYGIKKGYHAPTISKVA